MKMFKICAICGKKPLTGKSVVRKGLLKKKGGTGSKIVRWTKRKFLPNLQRIHIIVDGRPKAAYVCAKCLKKGVVKKA
jgi:large subunit ribosomal protein L28